MRCLVFVCTCGINFAIAMETLLFLEFPAPSLLHHSKLKEIVGQLCAFCSESSQPSRSSLTCLGA